MCINRITPGTSPCPIEVGTGIAPVPGMTYNLASNIAEAWSAWELQPNNTGVIILNGSGE